MFDTDLVAVAAELADADPMVCDRDELTALVRRSHRVRGWLDAFDARVALRADQLSAPRASPSRPPRC